ncbi:hypothetical protein [Brevibacillus laterosporus]|nr:hypothetical protein [Brevibacillus laterosporus]
MRDTDKSHLREGKNLAGAMVCEYSHDAEDGIIKYLSKHLNKV